VTTAITREPHFASFQYSHASNLLYERNIHDEDSGGQRPIIDIVAISNGIHMSNAQDIRVCFAAVEILKVQTKMEQNWPTGNRLSVMHAKPGIHLGASGKLGVYKPLLDGDEKSGTKPDPIIAKEHLKMTLMFPSIRIHVLQKLVHDEISCLNEHLVCKDLGASTKGRLKVEGVSLRV
jgi:hypothetical protein